MEWYGMASGFTSLIIVTLSDALFQYYNHETKLHNKKK